MNIPIKQIKEALTCLFSYIFEESLVRIFCGRTERADVKCYNEWKFTAYIFMTQVTNCVLKHKH